MEERKGKIDEEISSIFGETLDGMKPTKENTTEFANNLDKFRQYRDTINCLREEIIQLM